MVIIFFPGSIIKHACLQHAIDLPLFGICLQQKVTHSFGNDT